MVFSGVVNIVLLLNFMRENVNQLANVLDGTECDMKNYADLRGWYDTLLDRHNSFYTQPHPIPDD